MIFKIEVKEVLVLRMMHLMKIRSLNVIEERWTKIQCLSELTPRRRHRLPKERKRRKENADKKKTRQRRQMN